MEIVRWETKGGGDEAMRLFIQKYERGAGGIEFLAIWLLQINFLIC